MEFEFEYFPKIARLSREMVITEKIDGTNAQIIIANDQIKAGSRSKLITPEDDNYGFARWVEANKEELIAKLGPGRHYGEWWGSGIQRGYDLPKGEKRFSLFESGRWAGEPLPAGVFVVPELYRGEFDTNVVNEVLKKLAETGSQAAPGYMNPEGIIVTHVPAMISFKKTIHNDDKGKDYGG